MSTFIENANTQQEKIKYSLFNEKSFVFKSINTVQPVEIEKIINGVQAGIIIPKFLPNKQCSKIAENFWGHPFRYERTEDNVPAYCVGTFHYRKSLHAYFSEANQCRQYLNELFNGADNIFSSLINTLRIYFSQKGLELRLARHGKSLASPFVMRSWAGGNQHALLPHEDEAQCTDPQQVGFEIQEAAKNPLVAVNICLENAENGGDLCYWNIIPTQAMRKKLKLTYTGFPYPLEMLANIPQQKISIGPGDIYFFNGEAIHAVSAMLSRNSRRATISFLMARLNKETIIYWS